MSKLNTAGLSANTVSITDYRLVSDTMAKVVVAFTGRQNKESIQEMLSAKLQHMATPVENSFRLVKAGVAIGYVRANVAVRSVTDQEISAGYKTIAKSNILMDNADSTLWRVKEGAGGTKYLAREGNEDLTNLINASVNRRSDTPCLTSIQAASVDRNDFVAFASASGDVDYGFCVATASDKLKVVSASTQSDVVVSKDAVVSSLEVELPVALRKQLTASGVSRDDINQSIAYYRQLFGYAPEYLAQIIQYVEDTATA